MTMTIDFENLQNVCQYTVASNMGWLCSHTMQFVDCVIPVKCTYQMNFCEPEFCPLKEEQ